MKRIQRTVSRTAYLMIRKMPEFLVCKAFACCVLLIRGQSNYLIRHEVLRNVVIRQHHHSLPRQG
eukprot:768633-Hanusia_phi.AAC.12